MAPKYIAYLYPLESPLRKISIRRVNGEWIRYHDDIKTLSKMPDNLRKARNKAPFYIGLKEERYRSRQYSSPSQQSRQVNSR